MSEPKITVITPTGDRPLAFSLCRRWMAAQTRQPDQWIVIDDGKEALQPAASMQYIRRSPRPSDPKHTLALNLKVAVPLVEGDLILIMEDDEYYSPRYIEMMVTALESHPIAGIANARYYHLPTGGYYRNHNDRHASLAETAFHRSVLYDLFGIVNESDEPFIDIKLWKALAGKGNLFDDSADPLYLGIKGLPGRKGIGGGHRPEMYRGKSDTIDRDILKAWVPKDWQVYSDILADTRARHVSCDIIVPTYENEDQTVACFESIRANTKIGTYRVIWVDNGSKNISKAERALEGTDHIVVRLSRNVGFVMATNRGLQISNSDYVCLLNNDTVLPTRWLEKLIGALKEHPEVGIIGPLTSPSSIPMNYDSHHNIRHIEDNAHRRIFPEFVNLDDFNRKLEMKFDGHLADVSFVAFLCAVIKREVIEKVTASDPLYANGLNTNYNFGMYDDNDYNLAARKAGYETKLLYSTCIYHRGRSTFDMVQKTEGLDVLALLKRNRQILMKQWGLKRV